jgi:hypothetical protein
MTAIAIDNKNIRLYLGFIHHLKKKCLQEFKSLLPPLSKPVMNFNLENKNVPVTISMPLDFLLFMTGILTTHAKG